MQTKRMHGLTLIEAIIAIAIVAFASLGALLFQYYGAKHFRLARADLTATNIGQCLLEDWKSTGAVLTYDPNTLDMGFSLPSYSSDSSSNSISTHVTVNRIRYDVTLNRAQKDYDANGFAGTLYQIKATVSWPKELDESAPAVGVDPTLVFTTYARPGQD